jgi:GNAT superfamily N-acetyltransferase
MYFYWNACRGDEWAGELIAYRGDDEWTLESLFVENQFRGQGLGTCLLYTLSNYIHEQQDSLTMVTWTDASDRCFHPDNIYLKVGAIYVDDGEMIWNTRNIGVQSIISHFSITGPMNR